MRNEPTTLVLRGNIAGAKACCIYENVYYAKIRNHPQGPRLLPSNSRTIFGKCRLSRLEKYHQRVANLSSLLVLLVFKATGHLLVSTRMDLRVPFWWLNVAVDRCHNAKSAGSVGYLPVDTRAVIVKRRKRKPLNQARNVP